ncbi:hypothetical protein Acr_07g0016650 [Actinidia rufa]|uniref:Uncharacterized protein n=1 Tax=Actinidia rufa TaxID=165716 RepID=A0A7J0EZW1_9ERIC|nr:hypothetical protein Acr_07g0016650 [Actinidia rufa]
MPSRNVRGRAKSLTGARGVRGARGARRNLNERDDHQESVMGGRASAPMGNVGNDGGVPSAVFGGAEFMQGVFTVIKQVVRNTIQTMHVPVRVADSRTTTAMKAFLQLCPPTFKGEPDLLMVEDWLEQVTRALDTILVADEELRVLFASYQLQGDALQCVAAAIEKTLNETRKIKNPKSQREGTSNKSEGHSFKKPKSSTTQQQYPVRPSPASGVK